MTSSTGAFERETPTISLKYSLKSIPSGCIMYCLDNPAYKESWEKKRDFYKSIGYIEGVNLFTTVDHENGSIDSTEIAAIVDKLEDLI